MSKLNITFTSTDFNDYEYWLKLLKKINSLIKSIQSDGLLEGDRKSEQLKGNLQSYCSRCINHDHRLVYTFFKNKLLFLVDIIIKKSVSIY